MTTHGLLSTAKTIKTDSIVDNEMRNNPENSEDFEKFSIIIKSKRYNFTWIMD